MLQRTNFRVFSAYNKRIINDRSRDRKKIVQRLELLHLRAAPKERATIITYLFRIFFRVFWRRISSSLWICIKSGVHCTLYNVFGPELFMKNKILLPSQTKGKIDRWTVYILNFISANYWIFTNFVQDNLKIMLSKPSREPNKLLPRAI